MTGDLTRNWTRDSDLVTRDSIRVTMFEDSRLDSGLGLSDVTRYNYIACLESCRHRGNIRLAFLIKRHYWYPWIKNRDMSQKLKYVVRNAIGLQLSEIQKFFFTFLLFGGGKTPLHVIGIVGLLNGLTPGVMCQATLPRPSGQRTRRTHVR